MCKVVYDHCEWMDMSSSPKGLILASLSPALLRRVRNIRDAVRQGDVNILAGMRVAVKQLPVNADVLGALQLMLGEAGFHLREEVWLYHNGLSE